MSGTASPPATRSWLNRFPSILTPARQTLRRAWRRLTWPAPAGPIFHVTHYKAGSQWVLRVLYELAEPWVVPARVDNGQFLSAPIQPRGVYPTVYVTREQFEAVKLPRESRRFVVIRDLRDTLVSAYFSLKVSHRVAHEAMGDLRARLQGMTTQRALLCLTREWCDGVAAIQRSWLGGPDELLRYEDFLVRDAELFERVLVERCGLPTTRERLRAVVAANRFEARAGRKPGQEDVASHERKGIAGDWRNHFTDRVAKLFKERYGDLLVATGYEKDDRW